MSNAISGSSNSGYVNKTENLNKVQQKNISKDNNLVNNIKEAVIDSTKHGLDKTIDKFTSPGAIKMGKVAVVGMVVAPIIVSSLPVVAAMTLSAGAGALTLAAINKLDDKFHNHKK